MLSSISPLGERARAARWGLTVTAYVIGSTAGGAMIGSASGFLGSLIDAQWRASPWGALAVLLAVASGLVLDVRARGDALPSWRRQVDDAWLARYRGWVYGLGFGVQLGMGVATIVTSSTVYVVLVLAVWSGSAPVGMALGAMFGLVRALPVLTLRHVQRPTELRRFFVALERWSRPVDRLSRGMSAVVALAAVGLMVTAGGW